MADVVSPKLSCILVNFKLGKQVSDCLAGILQSINNDFRCEFIVVDNTPPDCVVPLFDGRIPNLQIISNPENPGYAAACNLGLRNSHAPYVLFLNPDVKYIEGSVLELLKWLDEHPSVAIAGPCVLNAGGGRQFSCRGFPTLANCISHRGSILTRFFPNNGLTRDYLCPGLDREVANVDWASGCCLFVRRHALEEVGGFDEGYFLFYEDVDLAFRMSQRGFTCVYYPFLTFSHAIGSSRVYLSDSGIKAKHLSAARYFTKHVIRNPFVAKLFRLGVSLRCRLAQYYHRRRRLRASY